MNPICEKCGNNLTPAAVVCLVCGAVVPSQRARPVDGKTAKPSSNLGISLGRMLPAVTRQSVDSRLWQMGTAAVSRPRIRHRVYTWKEFWLGLIGQAEISGVVIEAFDLSQIVPKPRLIGRVICAMVFLAGLSWLWSVPSDIGLAILLALFCIIVMILRFGMRGLTVLMFFSRGREKPKMWERVLTVELPDGKGEVQVTLQVPDEEQSKLRMLSPRSRLNAKGRWRLQFDRRAYPKFCTWRNFDRERQQFHDL